MTTITREVDFGNGSRLITTIELPPHVADLKAKLDEIREHMVAVSLPYLERGLSPYGPELSCMTKQIQDLLLWADRLCWPYTTLKLIMPPGWKPPPDLRIEQDDSATERK